MNPLFVGVVLIVLHAVDGHEVYVNPDHIAILRPTSEAARGTPNQLIVKGATCVVGLSDGKFVSVIETCAAVRDMMDQSEKLK